MSAGLDTGGMEGDREDFFVSHAGADRAWAEWVAWQLTDARYTVELDAWDWAVGQNFIEASFRTWISAGNSAPAPATPGAAARSVGA